MFRKSLLIHNIIGYGSEPSGYGDDDALPDLTPFLILGIAILGLSLLFPTAVHIQNVGPITGTGTGTGGILGMGRKRRYVDEGNICIPNACVKSTGWTVNDAIFGQACRPRRSYDQLILL